MSTAVLDEKEEQAIREEFGRFLSGRATSGNLVTMASEATMHQDSHIDGHTDAS